MKITQEPISQILIVGADGLDPIRVMWTDYGPGQGRITITCWDEAWCNYWGAMGPGWNMVTFFIKASTDYLVNKLKSGVNDTICDDEAKEQGCRAEVLKQRREDDIDKKTARQLWDRIEWADFDSSDDCNSDLFFDIFGDEWWYQLPQRPNPEYVRMCKVVNAVKEGLRQHISELEAA